MYVSERAGMHAYVWRHHAMGIKGKEKVSNIIVILYKLLNLQTKQVCKSPCVSLYCVCLCVCVCACEMGEGSLRGFSSAVFK